MHRFTGLFCQPHKLQCASSTLIPGMARWDGTTSWAAECSWEGLRRLLYGLHQRSAHLSRATAPFSPRGWSRFLLHWALLGPSCSTHVRVHSENTPASPAVIKSLPGSSYQGARSGPAAGSVAARMTLPHQDRLLLYASVEARM